MRPSENRSLALGIFGLCLVIFGIISLLLTPSLFSHIMRKELSLSPSSRSFGIWKDTGGIPLHLDCYFFNWTNPEELKIPGKKPIVEQVGPYSFREFREKTNITFHPENNTVGYFQKRTWIFDPTTSNGSLQDQVTQLNVVAVAAASKVRYWAYYWQTSLSFLLNSDDALHVTKSVDNLLFTGYQDKLIDMGQFSSVALGDMPPYDKFGWFYTRNGSSGFDGHFNMATGGDDLKDLGEVRKWNHASTTKCFEAPCNMVEGSAGEFWPPGRTKDEIRLFTADICRTLTYEYTETVTRHGIEGYRYSIGEKTLRNDTQRRYPHEVAKYFNSEFVSGKNSSDPREEADDTDAVNVGKCFCDGDCYPSGIMNATACRYGAPAYVSLPHFHNADPVYRDAVSGMNPSEDKHSFYITLEPTTGIPIDVAARLQINILLEPLPYLSVFADVPKIYFPMFWFEQRAGITKEMASPLRLFLQLPVIGFYSSIAMIFLGSTIAIGVIALQYLQRRRGAVMNPSSKRCTGLGQNSELALLNKPVSTEEKVNSKEENHLYPDLVGDK